MDKKELVVLPSVALWAEPVTLVWGRAHHYPEEHTCSLRKHVLGSVWYNKARRSVKALQRRRKDTVMTFDIRLSSDAKRDIQLLRVVDRRKVLSAFDIHLRYEPTKESKSRIKRLRRMETPQYRLRVDAIRIFYDVIEQDIVIIAVIHKECAAEWLAREGIIANESALTPEGEDEEDRES